jgi:hypothetical protein
MRILVLAAAPALLLAACGGETGEAANETAAAAVPVAFPVGEWEVTSTVERIGSTDGTTPAIAAKPGDSATRKACVAEASQLSSLFAPEGVQCTAMSDYARQGRINTAYKCAIPGGVLTPTVNGRYTADTLDVIVDSASMLSGSGDYQMSAKVTGKRLGDCPAAG